MCDVDKLTSQLLELSKQLENSSKSFKLTLKTKDINFTVCSQVSHSPGQDFINPGALPATVKKKKKSPSQKKRDSERRKQFLMDKSEITTEPLKPFKENKTSNDMDEHEESFHCEICEIKAKCKESLGKHMQKEHCPIPQLDGLEDSGEKGLDPCPLCKIAREVPDLGECGMWG